VTVVLFVVPALATVQRSELNTGWQFRALNKEVAARFQQWHPAKVPGVVQTDLLDNRLIPDPFYQDNESRLQWIGLTDWEYTTEFQVDNATLARDHIELAFTGLDTFAEVFLNEQLILSANNMFRDWRVACKQQLQAGKNVLRIVFRSPVMKLLPILEKRSYQLPSVNTAQTGAERGIPTDPFTRKAPYHYGWDWGPRFVTMGVWRPVLLESWDGVRIRDLHISQRNVTSDQARLDVEVDVETQEAQNATIQVRYETGGSSKTITVKQEFDRGSNTVSVPVRIPNPKRWFPAGYGEQNRYRFTVTVKTRSSADVATRWTGLRSIELRREKDQWGRSFTFVINGIPVFAKGVNVIPMDSFLPRVTHERRRKLLAAMRAANMNMLRQWGGGAYEADDFYDICDELGIMVWQEFMFGGAMVPGDVDFQENVRQEAIDNVKRLRDHPSIVIWCGNNEMETGWHNWGDRQSFKNSLPPDVRERVWQDYVVLFRDVLKSVVTAYSPQTPYWPSSPSANFEAPPDSPNDGDMHYWAVWHALEPIQQYTKQTPRFMSEFGFQSFPELATIDTFATDTEHRIDSTTMRAHQKNIGGNERILTYMLREYREPKDFDSFIYLSQVQQAEAIKVGAEHFRRLRPRTMGALYWQLNDCWPVASWSSIDYEGRWKALQYFAARFFADVLISPFHHDGKIDVFAVNDGLLPLSAVLRQRLMDFSGKVLSDESIDVELVPQSSTLIATRADVDILKGADPNQVVAVYELISGGNLLSRNEIFFNKVRNLALPKATIKADLVIDNGKKIITLSSPTIARHVSLTFGNYDAHASDNYFDLLPNEPMTVTVESGASIEELKRAMKVMSVTDAYVMPTSTGINH
jgi:beta-mannosidase